LKHTDRVSLLQGGIDCRVVLRQLREIDFLVIIIANDLNRLFDRRHHAETKQIDLDDAQIGAVFFVPLHNDAAGHRRRLKWHHRIQLPLTNHHAAGMLTQMSRQVLHGQIKLKKFLDAPVTQI
jgi:hypothetical protein